MGAKVPVLVGGVDIYTLPLSPVEGFVLSRVDGSATIADIAMTTSVPAVEVDTILNHLEDLGALKQPWKAGQPRPRLAPSIPSGPAPEVLYDDPPVPPDYELSELDQPADINLEIRRRILNAYHSVDDFDLYEVLGVPRDAKKKQIRASYFALSKRFHPDAFFGRKLGVYESRLEHVFKRLTEAYETLGRKKRRAEYDQYLESTSATREVTSVLLQAQEDAAEISAAPEVLFVEGRGMPSSEALRAPRVPDIARPRVKRTVPSRAPSSPGDRRKAAAVRLKRGLDSMSPAPRSSRPPIVRQASSMPPVSKKEKRDSVIKDLARTLRASSSTGAPPVIDRIQGYLDQAKVSQERDDVVGASNVLQLALALDPENEEVRTAYEEVSAGVAAALAGNYEKQARYEERVGKWEAAATSWGHVVEGRPDDVHANRSAALALLRSSGDLHLAQKCAEVAIRLQPDSVDNLVALAEVYLGAGLKLNARRELEKAVKLDGDNEVVKNLLREAK